MTVLGLSGVTSIATYYNHTLALKSDGTVVAWGENGSGQLGDGTTTTRLSPVSTQLGLWNGHVDIVSTGASHTAITAYGWVAVWGNNSYGQRGIGTTTSILQTQEIISGLENVVALAAGANHTAALKFDGSVVAWGLNNYGQLGDGTTTNRLIPAAVSGGVNLGAGVGKASQTVSFGATPTIVMGGTGAISVTATSGFAVNISSLTPGVCSVSNGIITSITGGTCTIAADQMGNANYYPAPQVTLPIIINKYNQTVSFGAAPTAVVGGIGTVSATATSGLVVSFNSATPMICSVNGKIVTGLAEGTCYITADQAGNGNYNAAAQVSQAVSISKALAVPMLAAGSTFSVALKSDGTVAAWGDNSYGQLGDGTTTQRSVPVAVPGLSGVVSLSAGSDHTVALKSDGTVVVWGRNLYGQLGDGTTTNRLSPKTVPGLSGVRAVSAGTYCTAALKSDGTVVMWGYNQYGQLGNGTYQTSLTAVPVTGLSTVVAVSAGSWNTVALKSDGTVAAWGYYTGDGTATARPNPVVVPGLSGVVAVSAGNYYTVALKSDGTVVTWGGNSYGNLGDGTTTTRLSPITVPGLSGVVSISASNGYSHTKVIKSDGTVMGWGDNSGYEQAEGGTSTTNRLSPVAIPLLSGSTAAIGGARFGLALKSDGSVVAWGYEGNGQLGNNTSSGFFSTPVTVSGGLNLGRFITPVTSSISQTALSFAAQNTGYSSAPQTVTLTNTGSNLLSITGIISSGDFARTTTCGATLAEGAGCDISVTFTPTTAGIRSGSITVANSKASSLFTISLSGSGINGVPAAPAIGTASGGNGHASVSFSVPVSNGGAGISEYTVTSTPDGISATGTTSPINVTGLTNGRAYTFTVTASNSFGIGAASGASNSVTPNIADQTVSFGLLLPLVVDGTGTVSATASSGLEVGFSSVTPDVCDVSGTLVTGLTEGTCIIAADQPGNNDFAAAAQATLSIAVNPAISPMVVAGGAHTVALRSDGTVATWGNNSYGQLGDGSSTNRLSPVILPGLSGVAAVAASTNHTVALKSDGTVVTWGYNNYGQLGDGSTTSRLNPVTVPGLSKVVSVAAGDSHTVALRSDGTMVTWGYNNYGQLGNGTFQNSLTPVSVTGLRGVVAVAAGNGYSVALKSDGTVVAWGSNTYGQLGTGNTLGYVSPVAVPGLSGVAAIAASAFGSATVAIKSDGSVVAWGNNNSGQLGDGTTTSRLNPVIVPGFNGVLAVSEGGAHTLTLKPDRTVWGWGYNSYGQLGDTTQTNRLVPVTVPGLADVLSVSAGSNHSVALISDGTVLAWGYNGTGQLGNGTTTYSKIPVSVSGPLNLMVPIVKIDQTVTFGAAPSIAVGGTGTVSATATSGRPVIFSSLTPGVCTVTAYIDGIVTGDTAGSCTIAADQAGNTHYNAAPQVTQTFTIARAGQTVSLYTPRTLAKNGTGTVSATATSNLPVTFSSTTPTTCSVNDNIVTGNAFGDCVIAADQAGDDNYLQAPRVTGTIEIGKQSIELNLPVTLTLGGTGTLSAFASSGLAVSLHNLTPGVCTLSGTIITGITVGTCTITADQEGSGNYQAAPQVTRSTPVKPAVYYAPKFAYVLNVQSTDLLLYTVDPITNELTTGASMTLGGFEPDSVALDPAGRYAYFTGNEPDPANVGYYVSTVRSYKIDQATGALTAVTRLQGDTYNYSSTIIVDPSGRFAYRTDTAGAGDISVYTIDQVTGTLTPGTPVAAELFSGSVVVDPSSSFAYVVDYNSSKIAVFTIDQVTGALNPQPPIVADAPRSMVFEPTGRFAYILGNHYDPDSGSYISRIHVYRINQSTGDLTSVDELAADSYLSKVKVDPSGRFAYVYNTVTKAITSYIINQTTGSLTGGTTTEFGHPTFYGGFSIDPAGKFFYYVSPGDSHVYVYAIDQTTGALNATTGVPPVGGYPDSGLRMWASIAISGSSITPPAAPVIGTATAGAGQATVNFTAPLNNGGSAITGYTVTSSPGGLTATGTESPITITGLMNGSAYTFTVAAANYAGSGPESGSSIAVTPRKLDQTITFGTAPGLIYGGATGTVNASGGGSGLPVTFDSQTLSVCTISGTTVTAAAAGDCVIAANQAGNNSYNAAPQVTQSITVSKATAVIDLGGLTATYDGTAKNISATTTPAGLSVAITYGGSPTPPVNVGVYEVIATISDARYQGTASGTLIITQPTLSVTVTGDGSGDINSNPAGITCSQGTAGICSHQFPPGTVTLHATASGVSLPGEWGGCTSSTAETCTVQLGGNKSISMTFSLAPQTMVGGTGFNSIGAAYLAVFNSPDSGATLKLLDTLLTGDLVVQGKNIVLKGGYSADYSSRSGVPTVLKGTLIVKGGSLRVDGVYIRR